MAYFGSPRSGAHGSSLAAPAPSDFLGKVFRQIFMCDQHRPELGLPRHLSAPESKSEASRINHTVFTRASCDVAWKVFSECKLWPGFSERYDSAVRWQGTPWEPGSRVQFDILAPDPARVLCVVTLCAPPQCVAWINHVNGYTMQQCVLFEPYYGGGTRITTWIELTDPELNGGSVRLRAVLKSLLHTWFGNFTAECDHRARAAGHRI